LNQIQVSKTLITSNFVCCLKIFGILDPYMRPQIVIILALALSLWNSATLLGQSVTDNPPPPPQRTVVDLPIDSGVYLLFIVAIIFGIYLVL